MHLASFLELHGCPAATQQAGLLQGATADSQAFTKEVPALNPPLGKKGLLAAWHEWAGNNLFTQCLQ